MMKIFLTSTDAGVDCFASSLLAITPSSSSFSFSSLHLSKDNEPIELPLAS